MPVTWRMRGFILVVTTTGAYRNAELADALDAAEADPARTPGTPVLFDGRESKAALTKLDIEWRVAQLLGLPARGFARQVAFVAGSEPHRYGLGRMLQGRVETHGVEVGIFLDFDEACGWLTAQADG